MIHIRKSQERGHSEIGWQNSYHTFSFGDYHDPQQMGFRTLRVINEDRVASGQGFGAHPHRDMEIISYVLEGQLEHRDSLGTGSVIRPGEVQLMSAGSGVTHSEFNPSSKEAVHFLQIWIVPEAKGLKPSYQQKFFDLKSQKGKLVMIVSPRGREALKINQQAELFVGMISKGQKIQYSFADNRYSWLQVVRGKVQVNGQALIAGDGAAISQEKDLQISALEESEILLFDLS